MVDPSPLVIATSGKFTFAIELRSGMTRWAYALKSDHTCRVVVANDKVYIAGQSELASLEYATGREVFHINTDLGPDITLLVDGDHIYVGSNGRVACYGQFGERHWLNDLGTNAGIGFAVPGLAQQIDLR